MKNIGLCLYKRDLNLDDFFSGERIGEKGSPLKRGDLTDE